jgi:hypothetical protein
MRKLSGILYGISLSALDETTFDKHIKALISSVTDKNRNKSLELYASLYALSSIHEYRFFNSKNVPLLIEQDTFSSLGKHILNFILPYVFIIFVILYIIYITVLLLDDTSPLIVGAACDVIGAIGRLNPIPIEERNKAFLIKKLLSISFNNSTLSKVKFYKI